MTTASDSPPLAAGSSTLSGLLAGGLRILRRKWGPYLALLALGAASVRLLMPFDPALLELIRQGNGEGYNQAARVLSYAGQTMFSVVPLAALLWWLGRRLGRIRWQQAGVACLLAVLLAGLFGNGIKITLGRARPSSNLVDRFYGPSLGYDYLGFPSTHATSTFGMASSLCLTVPVIGVPATAFALAVVWSRMQLRRHYLSDILFGAVIGIIFGTAFGLAAREPFRHLASGTDEPPKRGPDGRPKRGPDEPPQREPAITPSAGRPPARPR